MTYSNSKYQLTHLLQDAWYRLGALTTWKITGGTTTTVVNSAWAGVEEQIFDDDDPALIYGSVVVSRDAAGAGAAPEGEIARITDYDSSTYTITHDALTVAPASGDSVGIASPQYPYEDMKELVNIAFRKLGKIDRVDTSLTVVASQTEYTMPIYTKPKRVRVQTSTLAGDNQWRVVNNWEVIPQTAGTPWKLVVPQLNQGYSIELLYEGFHPEVTAFDSEISEVIFPDLALNALLAECYQWYNNKVQGSNAYLLQRENKALQDLEQAKLLYPIAKLDEQVTGLPHWGRRGEYVHKTSDLRA